MAPGGRLRSQMLTLAIVALAFGCMSGLFIGLPGLLVGLGAAVLVVAMLALLQSGFSLWLIVELLGLAAALQIGYALGLVGRAIHGTRDGAERGHRFNPWARPKPLSAPWRGPDVQTGPAPGQAQDPAKPPAAEP